MFKRCAEVLKITFTVQECAGPQSVNSNLRSSYLQFFKLFMGLLQITAAALQFRLCMVDTSFSDPVGQGYMASPGF